MIRAWNTTCKGSTVRPEQSEGHQCTQVRRVGWRAGGHGWMWTATLSEMESREILSRGGWVAAQSLSGYTGNGEGIRPRGECHRCLACLNF